jgi:predicted nucleic acid-binding Zn ribbon protein
MEVTIMFCKRCGKEADTDGTFCKFCGKILNDNSKEKTETGIETAGYVFGTLGLFAWLLPLVGYPITIIGLIFSVIGMQKERKYAKGAVGMCLVCLVLTVINSISGAIMYSNY